MAIDVRLHYSLNKSIPIRGKKKLEKGNKKGKNSTYIK